MPLPTYTLRVGYTTPEEEWRALLTGNHQGVQRLKRAFRAVPHDPRCKLCHAPFAGIGGTLLRPWFGPWERNAQLCKNCVGALTKAGVGGAEVELSMLFADIRGSTGLGERLRPTDFNALLNSFYRLAARAIIDSNGVVDKFVGDEAIGLVDSGLRRRRPCRAGHRGRSGHPCSRRPRGRVGERTEVPVGAGVHTGVAFVGSPPVPARPSPTSLRSENPVNTTARLASLAKGGELLVSVVAAERAGLDTSAWQRRDVEVRGREAGLAVYSVPAA